MHRLQQNLISGKLPEPGFVASVSLPEWPDGLANASGLVGRNLMFHGGELLAVWPPQRASSEGPRKTIGLRDFYSYNGLRLGSLQSLGVSAGYGNILAFLYTWFDASPNRHFRLFRRFLGIPALVASKLLGNATIFALIVEDFGEPENRIVLDPQRPGPSRFVTALAMNSDIEWRSLSSFCATGFAVFEL